MRQPEESASSQPVSTQVVRIVKPGQEPAFEAALRDFFQNAAPIPGQLSVHVVRPLVGSNSREYGILRTFRDEAARDNFFSSDLFLQHSARMAEYVEGGPERQDLCGLETWFTRPGSRAMVPPPRWKMAVVTFIGVFLTSNVIARLVGPFVQGLPALAASAVGVAISVVCLTWLVMPTLSRLFRPWLAPLPVTELQRADPTI